MMTATRQHAYSYSHSPDDSEIDFEDYEEVKILMEATRVDGKTCLEDIKYGRLVRFRKEII